jgi:hypothetical protein
VRHLKKLEFAADLVQLLEVEAWRGECPTCLENLLGMAGVIISMRIDFSFSIKFFL